MQCTTSKVIREVVIPWKLTAAIRKKSNLFRHVIKKKNRNLRAWQIPEKAKGKNKKYKDPVENM